MSQLALLRITGPARGMVAAIATIVSVGTAVSIMPPLLALRLEARGVPERTIGAVLAVTAVAALVATPFAARLAARFGLVPTIAAALCAASVLVPVLAWAEAMPLLLPAAFIYGMCIPITFTLSEAWINAAASEKHRGIVMGVYATLLSIGFALGPGILYLVGAHGRLAPLIGSAIMAAAILPALAARKDAPDVSRPSRTPFARFLVAVPLATFGVFCFAMAESGGFAFLPLWALRLGYEGDTAPLLPAAMTLGNVALQIPLGLLADRFDRRLILLVLGLAGALGMAAAALVANSPALLAAVLFLWGGATAGLYTVGLAHLASRVDHADLVGANAAFVFAYALGMLAAPLAVGEAMTRLPLTGFPLVLGAAFTLYVAVALRSILSGRRRLA